jgi:hypothetical protein
MRITFVADDFVPAFEAAGVRTESLTETEWRRFYNSFLDGTGWCEVAEIAADEIAENRRRET